MRAGGAKQAARARRPCGARGVGRHNLVPNTAALKRCACWTPPPRRRDFGAIKGYNAPKERHPGSIMALSNTGGHGRGGQSGRIIGDGARAATGRRGL